MGRTMVFALAALVVIAACSGSGEAAPTLRVAGIPERNAADLVRRYDGLTEYLSDKLGVKVEYVPTVDYAAAVTAFRQGDVHLGWFGGLTSVQARQAVPGSQAIAHRPRDAEFHSLFIVQSSLSPDSLDDLKGLTFSFGSESSTSGHLMPRHFLLQAGVDPATDFNGRPNFSGSHDTTWKLVESGSFQAGVLDESVWEAAVAAGSVDTSKVKVFYTTPPYFDYNWTVRGDIDQVFGAGFSDKLKRALLEMGESEQETLALFSTDRFVETNNGNYAAIEQVARSLGVIQ